jgi:hypothetical protein
LVIRLSRDDGQPPDSAFAELHYRDGIGSVKLHIEGGVAKSSLLPPGQHELFVHGMDFMMERRSIDILPNEETQLDLQLRTGSYHRLEFVDEEGAPPCSEAHIVIKDARGGLVGEVRMGRLEGGSIQYPLVLARGTYSVEATSNTGRRVSASFSISAESRPDEKPFVFTMR